MFQEHVKVQETPLELAHRPEVHPFVSFEPPAASTSFVAMFPFLSFGFPRFQTSNFVHQEFGFSIGFSADSVKIARLVAASEARTSSTWALSTSGETTKSFLRKVSLGRNITRLSCLLGLPLLLLLFLESWAENPDSYIYCKSHSSSKPRATTVPLTMPKVVARNSGNKPRTLLIAS